VNCGTNYDVFMAAAFGLIEPQDLHCPGCGYDLTGATMAVAMVASQGTNAPPTQPFNRDIRCPECGLTVPLAHLRGINNPDRNGAPRSLSPHETVVSGRLLVVILITTALVLALALNYLL
jgi:hypothetical protein